MPMRLRIYILLLAIALVGVILPVCGGVSYAQVEPLQQPIDEKDYLLLITSYAHDSRQVSEFMSEFEDANFARHSALDVKIESMGIIGLDDCNNWRGDLLTILRRQNPKYLKAVILIGQEAWTTYLGLGDQRPDVPFFGSGISDAGLEVPDSLENPSSWEPRSISNRQRIEAIGYGGAIFYKFDVAANVRLILSLFPDTKTIALLTDNTYGGVSIHANFRKVMHEQFGDISTILLDGREISLRGMQEAIAQLPPQTVLLLGTWRVDSKGTFFTGKILDELVQPRPDLPIFSLTGIGMRDIAIAGVLPEFSTPIRGFLFRVFSDVEHNVKDTFIMEVPNQLNVNKGNFRKMKLSEKALPAKYKVVDSENEEVLKYRRYLLIVMVLSVVMLGVLVYALSLMSAVKAKNAMLKRQAEELKAAKEQAEVSKEQAEVSDRLKTAFLANISHEVRTPINAIDGFSRLIGQSASIDNAREYIRYITDNTDKLLRLMTLIVDFAKVDSGIIDFNMADIGLAEFFDRIQARYESKIPREIHFECVKPYDCTINYDAEKLEQMISILLDNAIKFTRSGKITIGYYATPQSIKVYVTDTGIGIQQSNVHKIFDKFEKLGSFSEGTGIGLSYIKTLIERSGGNIRMVSRPDAGSRFVVELPCRITTSVINLYDYDRTEELLDADSLIVDKQFDKPLKILVAEDNNTNFTLLKSILKTHDLNRVCDGAEAVKALQDDWYDIVLMDIRMPMMDGIQATAEIRKFDLSTPIIAVTAYDPDTYKPQAEKAGCDFFIEKPFTRSKIYSAILGLMHRQ